MTQKMKEAIKKLEESPFADIHTKTAQSLYVRGVVEINGFSKTKPAHLNCSLTKPAHLNCSLKQGILF